MKGSWACDKLGKMLLIRRNMKCKDSEMKLNLKGMRDGNKADVAQI